MKIINFCRVNIFFHKFNSNLTLYIFCFACLVIFGCFFFYSFENKFVIQMMYKFMEYIYKHVSIVFSGIEFYTSYTWIYKPTSILVIINTPHQTTSSYCCYMPTWVDVLVSCIVIIGFIKQSNNISGIKGMTNTK